MVLLALVGCDSAIEPTVALSLGDRPIPVVEDSDGLLYILDTGAPRTILTPLAAQRPSGTFAEEPVPDWELPGFSAADSNVVVADLSAGNAAVFGGVIGMDLLSTREVTFDHRSARAWLGPVDTGLPTPDIAAPFRLLGPGGTCLAEGSCYEWDSARIVVPIVLDGVQTHAVLDTGNEYTAVTPSLLARLPPMEGRPRLRYIDGPQATAETEYSRIGLATVGEAQLEDLVIWSNRDDLRFAKLQVETGVGVEVLLGQSFLRNFAMTIDWGGTLVFAEHEMPDPKQRSEWVGIGARIDDAEGCFQVQGVVEGHAAAIAGLAAGDCLTAVDGWMPATHAAGEVARRVSDLGVGAQVVAVVRRDGRDESITLVVADMLPPVR